MQSLKGNISEPIVSKLYHFDAPNQANQDKYSKKTALIAQRVWLALAATTAIAVALSVTAVVFLPGAIAITALVVTTVALTLLCIYKIAQLAQPYFSGRLLKVCDVVTSCYDEATAFLLITACYVRSFFKNLAAEDKKKLDAIRESGQIEPVNKTPVLLVHGFLANSYCWYWQKKRLEAEGFTVYTIDLGPHPKLCAAFDSIEHQYAEKVKERVAEIVEAHGCNQTGVIIAGHSMGGLVASQCAANMPEGTVKAVITLGSPLNGTHLASLACKVSLGRSRCADEMQRSSPLTERLNEHVRRCAMKHFYNLSSGTDVIILPNSSARFKELPAAQQRHYRSMGHIQYLVSGAVTDDMLMILNHYNSPPQIR